MNKCIVEGCRLNATGSRGMCNMHYLRWRRHGDTDTVKYKTREGVKRARELGYE